MLEIDIFYLINFLLIYYNNKIKLLRAKKVKPNIFNYPIITSKYDSWFNRRFEINYLISN